MSLKHDLEEWESVVADGGYRGEKATTPTGFNGYYDKIKATVRARHENVNQRLKEFKCLKNIYRHLRQEHYLFFSPCVVMVQLGIERGQQIFQVDEYDEAVLI